jgi:hypothetical protein
MAGKTEAQVSKRSIETQPYDPSSLKLSVKMQVLGTVLDLFQ